MIAGARRAADALWPTMLLWVGLIVFAVWADANWPEGWRLQRTMLVWVFAAEYFLLKAAVMGVRMRHWDTLTATFIFTNLVLTFAFLLQIAALLWTDWWLRHRDLLAAPITYLLIAGFVLGIIELALIPPPVRALPLMQREPE